MNAKQRRKLVRQYTETILHDIATARLEDKTSTFHCFLVPLRCETRAMYRAAMFLRKYGELK